LFRDKGNSVPPKPTWMSDEDYKTLLGEGPSIGGLKPKKDKALEEKKKDSKDTKKK
jgi:hypothetical protein